MTQEQVTQAIEEMNIVKDENDLLSFEKEAEETVYSVDNYNNYYEAFNLAFTGSGLYENMDTPINIIETLERNGESELKQFYIDLLKVAEIEEYKPSLNDFFTYSKHYGIKKFSISNLINEASESFKELFYIAFDYKNFSFNIDRINLDEIDINWSNYDIFVFLKKYEELLNGLECDDKLEKVVMDIFYKVEYGMEIEYCEIIYNLENGLEW